MNHAIRFLQATWARLALGSTTGRAQRLGFTVLIERRLASMA